MNRRGPNTCLLRIHSPTRLPPTLRGGVNATHARGDTSHHSGCYQEVRKTNETHTGRRLQSPAPCVKWQWSAPPDNETRRQTHHLYPQPKTAIVSPPRHPDTMIPNSSWEDINDRPNANRFPRENPQMPPIPRQLWI
jgi:hypothetical protein